MTSPCEVLAGGENGLYKQHYADFVLQRDAILFEKAAQRESSI